MSNNNLLRNDVGKEIVDAIKGIQKVKDGTLTFNAFTPEYQQKISEIKEVTDALKATSVTDAKNIGTIQKKFPIYNSKGVLIGYIPIYNSL